MSKVYKMRNTIITRYLNPLINKYNNAKFEVILIRLTEVKNIDKIHSEWRIGKRCLQSMLVRLYPFQEGNWTTCIKI